MDNPGMTDRVTARKGTTVSTQKLLKVIDEDIRRMDLLVTKYASDAEYGNANDQLNYVAGMMDVRNAIYGFSLSEAPERESE